MKKVTSLLMALILSVTILMGSIPMNASAATTEVPVGWYQQGKKVYYYENGKKVTGWHTLKKIIIMRRNNRRNFASCILKNLWL